MSSIPFWQMSTFAPLFLTFSTIFLIMPSSSSRNACSCVGSCIWILASISVFLTSSAAFTRAIFAFLICFGIPSCTRSLSSIIPLIISVFAIPPPCFFCICMLSRSTIVLLPVFSATLVTASTTTSASVSFSALAPLLAIEVIAMFFSVFLSPGFIVIASLFSVSFAFVAASLYPPQITVG